MIIETRKDLLTTEAEIIAHQTNCVRVGELVEELDCEDEDIMVFDKDTQW